MLANGQNIENLLKNSKIKKKNIGFVASDPGGLIHCIPFIKYFSNEKNISIKFFISNDIKNLLSTKQINRVSITSFKDETDCHLIISKINKLKLDIFFLSQSFRALSLVNKVSSNLFKLNVNKIFVIQDFWGVLSKLKLNDNQKVNFKYIVLDKYAKTLLKEKGINNKSILINTLKKNLYSRARIISSFRKKYSFSGKKNIIFFAQPTSIQGIKENIFLFCSVINKFSKDYIFLIKPHPLEKNLDFFKSLKLNYDLKIINKNESTNKLFEISYLVINCFSSIGYEHSILQGMTKKNLGLLVYLRFGKKLNNTLSNLEKKNQGTIPFELPGIVISCKNDFLKIFSNKSFRQQLFKNYMKDSHKYLVKEKKIDYLSNNEFI